MRSTGFETGMEGKQGLHPLIRVSFLIQKMREIQKAGEIGMRFKKVDKDESRGVIFRGDETRPRILSAEARQDLV